MEEIDTSNILGRRTRGKTIDYAEAEQKAKEAGDTLEDDDDEDDDEDFDEGDQGDGDKMEE
jgi:Histone chaperone domain CHZ